MMRALQLILSKITPKHLSEVHFPVNCKHVLCTCALVADKLLKLLQLNNFSNNLLFNAVLASCCKKVCRTSMCTLLYA